MTFSKLFMHVRGIVQHFNEEKYWRRRECVINNDKIPKILKIYYLLYIKRCDAFNNASLGTYLGGGACFKDKPNFVHGLYGIIVAHDAVIGKNCVLYHQVTIGQNGGPGAPIIGDNVTIGAGAKIIGKVHVGNNCKIGANAVVYKDVPDNTTVVSLNQYLYKEN